VSGLENVERIAAVEGVDMIWFGQFDLTISMGFPGDFDHPDYSSAVKRVVDAAASCGKPAGMCCSSFEQAADYIDRGLRCIAFDDISLLESSMRGVVERTRSSMRSLATSDD
jgi:2-dehydro-3-deoxyglucarate aldolase/4-hydroxy-2-oxoheptanedioate aldolase